MGGTREGEPMVPPNPLLINTLLGGFTVLFTVELRSKFIELLRYFVIPEFTH